jgi:hypothetical protein
MVRLRDRWDIVLDMPLGDFGAPTAAAYAVEDLRSVGMSFAALVADPRAPVRGSALGLARMSKHNHVLTPVDYGAVDWSPSPQRRLAIIYERPVGGPLAPADDSVIASWPEEDIVNRVLVGVLAGLKALAIEGLTHRGIRPTNIYFRDAARRLAVLGDCITAPPAAHQPIRYETIESAMAMPGGRGNGTGADDLYALGVLCLHLMQGKPPGHGVADEMLIEEKIRRGSFNVLAAEARPSSSMLELLRGLLIDDREERWTLKDVEAWLAGRRLTPRVTSPAPRAARPFEFGAESCFTARSLGRALARAGESGVHVVRSHGLEVWLQRSLADKTLVEAVARALADGEVSAGANAAQDARAVAQVAIALDPAAPIRYRALAVAIDGLGSALAMALLTGGDVKPIAEILLARLPQFWCRCQPPARVEPQQQLRDYDRLRRVLEDHRPGFGIERLGYELEPALYCLSPFVASSCVWLLADLLPALEAAAAAGRIQALPVDRHIAAFIAHRSKAVDEAALVSIGNADPVQRLLGMLYILAQLQRDRGPTALPALTRIFGRQGSPLINRLHHRRTRERLEAELAGVVTEASLPRLLHFLDNAEEKQIDSDRFAKARHHFAMAGRAIGQCEEERSHLPDAAAQTASIIAAGVSMLLGLVGVLGAVLAFGPF